VPCFEQKKLKEGEDGSRKQAVYSNGATETVFYYKKDILENFAEQLLARKLILTELNKVCR
jgi:hypothetical protein